MTATDKRPKIDSIKSGAEFKRWYWLKKELVEFCRQYKLGTSGQKAELQTRIAHYLDTGEILKAPKKIAESSFDWRKAELTLDTIITDNYSNSQNMRRFMRENAGEHFSFSNEFMQWMRDSKGKTLADALAFWTELDAKKRNSGYREKPLPQNQYNQFTRALSNAKPGISSAKIRRIWAIKRSRPGPHIYEPGDENL